MEYGLAYGETADPGDEFDRAQAISSHRDEGVCASREVWIFLNMAKLATFQSGLGTFDARRVKAPPKAAASIYHTPEYQTWREAVITRAAGRCEAIDNDKRCWKSRAHGHRMFADHIVELRDGGAPFDPANGMCLCGAHHSAKTAQARADRR